MKRRERLSVTPGFLLLLAVLFYLDEGVGVLPWALLACAAHELGHYALGRALGGRLEWLELSAVGAQMKLRYPVPPDYWRELSVAMAGPAVNLALGWAFAAFKQFAAAGVSLTLGLFNLLPILPLDGGCALWCALAAVLDGDWADRILSTTAGLLVGLLAGTGAFCAVKYANFTLLIVSAWLLWGTLGERIRNGEEKCLHF